MVVPRHVGIFGPGVKFQPLTQDATIIDPYSRDLLQISAMSHQQLVALVCAQKSVVAIRL